MEQAGAFFIVIGLVWYLNLQLSHRLVRMEEKLHEMEEALKRVEGLASGTYSKLM